MVKLKENKRKTEKQCADALRKLRIDNDEDLDKAKTDLKAQIVRMRELKEERSDKDYERQRGDIKVQLEKHERSIKDSLEEEKEKIEKQ